MIKTDNVIEYFDKLAPTWDEELIRVDETVAKILKNAEIGAAHAFWTSPAAQVCCFPTI